MDIGESDRQTLTLFLSATQGTDYAPQSGQIIGIFKQMGDTMAADLESATKTEEAAIKTYDELTAAKKKEIDALTASIEKKMTLIGELGVEIVEMKEDLTDTEKSLMADQEFLANLEKSCATKTKEGEERSKTRAEELVALADTIKILNDDDALELFKKTLPSASASFVQVQESSGVLRKQAEKLLSQARSHMQPGHHRLDFVLLALHGRKVGFDKIVKLIDGLVATLKTEQQDDEHKKEYCEAQFDLSDDKRKVLVRSIGDTETVIEENKERLATLVEEIKALQAGIAALDKSVADATAQRKAESADNKEVEASNGAAKELILFAKNRLQKFYNPKLYKAAPDRVLSEGDRIYVNEGGDIPTAAPGGIANTGISAFMQLLSTAHAPPAPPPAVAAAYTKKIRGKRWGDGYDGSP